MACLGPAEYGQLVTRLVVESCKQLVMSLFHSRADRIARLGIGLLLVVLAVAGVSTAALVGSGNPAGRWATPRAIQAIVLSHKLHVGECESAPGAGFVPSGGNCKLGRPATKPGVVANPLAKVVSATVTGIGSSKLINGGHRYQLFDVEACTVYYYRGAHRFGTHFRWFTRRPPGGTTTSVARNGTISVGPDSGAPYVRDWNYPLFLPLAHGHC